MGVERICVVTNKQVSSRTHSNSARSLPIYIAIMCLSFVATLAIAFSFNGTLMGAGPRTHIVSTFMSIDSPEADTMISVRSGEHFDLGIAEVLQIIANENLEIFFLPENHAFTHWYTDVEMKNRFDQALPITDNLILYAGVIFIENPA